MNRPVTRTRIKPLPWKSPQPFQDVMEKKYSGGLGLEEFYQWMTPVK